jgi:predicted CXXCH cytochrome family protein
LLRDSRGGRITFDVYAKHSDGRWSRFAPFSEDVAQEEIDSHLVLYNNRIECQTCHSLTSNKNNLIAGFSDSSELCTGCHVRDWNKQ